MEQLGLPPATRQNLTRVNRPSPRSVTASQDELATLLRTADPAMRAFVLLTGMLALRFAEARAITCRMWNRENQTVTVPTKGRKEHTLPVPPQLEEVLGLAARSGQPDAPIIELLAGRTLTETGMRKRWQRLREKAGVNPKLRPHDLRRTVATLLYRQTHDLRAVQQLLGHKQLATTTQYIAPLHPDELRPLLNALMQWTPKGDKLQ